MGISIIGSFNIAEVDGMIGGKLMNDRMVEQSNTPLFHEAISMV